MKTNEKMSKYEAIEYLVKIGPSYTDEWTESAMYNFICKIVKSTEDTFSKEYLDKLLEQINEF